MILFKKRSSRVIVRSYNKILKKLTSFLKMIEKVFRISIRMKVEKLMTKLTKLNFRENLSKTQAS